MAFRPRRPLLFVLTLWAIGTVVLACEDSDFGSGIPFDFDASTQLGDAALVDVHAADLPDGADLPDAAALSDAADASAADDAAPDAGPPSPVDPFRGIWHGVGVQAGASWTILTDIHGGQPGSVVGMMNYPSLACGGTLVLNAADAGADAPDAGDAGDAGDADDAGDAGLPTITLHESVSATCIQEGEDTFTLLPDGSLAFEYRTSLGGPVVATGTLTRVGERGAASSTFGGIWHAGELNANNLRSLMVTISRDDAIGAPAGLFLIDRNGSQACGGHWTLASTSASALELTEVFADGQIGCDGPGTALLNQVVGGIAFSRSIDGGAAFDAGTDDAGLKLTRF